MFFPAQHGNNPWQPASSGASQKQPNLEAAVESFYKAGGTSFGSTFGPPPGSQPPSSGLQFGAFGAHTFPQFGQLGSSFGQAPFIPTGTLRERRPANPSTCETSLSSGPLVTSAKCQ